MYKTIKDLSIKDQNHLPTNQDIDSYNNKGWYISPIMIEASVIDDALQGVDEFYKGEKDFNFLNNSRIADEEYSDSMAIRNNEFVAHQNKKLRALAFHPLISATASLLAQTKEIRYFADSLINKVPEKPTSKGVVGWHSDKAYWPTCSSNKMLTAWIPLQDCTIEMGPLMHLDKSHLWKDDLELKTYFSFNNQNLEKFNDFLVNTKKNPTKSYMTLKKKDRLVFTIVIQFTVVLQTLVIQIG